MSFASGLLLFFSFLFLFPFLSFFVSGAAAAFLIFLQFVVLLAILPFFPSSAFRCFLCLGSDRCFFLDDGRTLILISPGNEVTRRRPSLIGDVCASFARLDSSLSYLCPLRVFSAQLVKWREAKNKGRGKGKKASPGSVGSGRSGNKFRMENLRLCPKGECDPDWSKHTGRSNESNRNRANNRMKDADADARTRINNGK